MLNKLLCWRLERTRVARDKWMYIAINLRSDLEVMSERLKDLYKDKGNLIDKNHELRTGIKSAIEVLDKDLNNTEVVREAKVILTGLIGEDE